MAVAALPVSFGFCRPYIVFFFLPFFQLVVLLQLPCHVSHIENCAACDAVATFQDFWLMPACHFGRENKVEHNVLISHFKEGFTYATAQESAHCTCCLLAHPLPLSLSPCGTHMWRVLNILLNIVARLPAIAFYCIPLQRHIHICVCLSTYR